MKRIFYAFVLLFFSVASVQAQYFTVAQCSGTPAGGLGTSTYGPMYSVATANAASRTAIIYPASQLTAIAGSPLTSIYFYRLTSTGTMAGTPNYKIYLKEVTSADWGSAFTSWADTIASATLVYNGNPASIVGSSAGWKAFPFSANFTYSGTRNLAVLTEYTNTTASTSITWTYEYTGSCINTSNSNTTKYSNNTTGTLNNTLGSTDYRRPYVGFDVFLTCYPPTNVTATGATTTSAQVSWTASTSAPANGYEYYYSTSSTAPTSSTTPSGTVAASTTSVQLSSLSTGTTYYVWVRSACSSSDKSPWASAPSFITLSPPPSNDSCGSPVSLSVGATCTNTSATTAGATSSLAATPCLGTPDDDVWFTFVANATDVKIDLSNVVAVVGTSTDMYFQVLSGSCGSLTSLLCSDPNSAVLSGLTPGQTYYIRVYTYLSGVACSFSICLTNPAAPTACPTLSAPASAAQVGQKPTLSWSSVTNATAYDIYLDGNNPPSTLLTTVTGTTTYTLANPLPLGTYYWYVVAKNSSGTFSNCTANVRSFTTNTSPANDDICNAVPLSVSTGVTCTTALTGQSTQYGTQSLAGCAGTADEDVWYSFVATNTTHYIALTTSGAGSTDRVHQVFSSSDNTCSGTLTSVLCSDPESSTVTGLVVGRTYFVRVYSYASTNYATFDICITSPAPPPANDLPNGAIILTVNADCSAAPYTNVGASLSTNEPRISCKGSQTAGAPVWFKFVAPTGGFVRVTTDVTGGTLTDTRIGLFSTTDTALSSYRIIACDDDNGSTVANASTLYANGLTPGATYYVAVDHWNGSSTGAFCVQVHSVTTTMVTPSGACKGGQTLAAYLADYKGFLSLTDSAGRLVANVRSNTTLSTTPTYTDSVTVNQGAVRQDGSGKYYLDRNFRITNSLVGNYDVQFFFLQTELTALQAVSPTTTLANLNLTRVSGEPRCNTNFASGVSSGGSDTLLVQTGNGAVNGVDWITVNTTRFSNFYPHPGTAPLPIKFEYLTGKKAGSTNALNWKVTCTSTSITMVLERSADARTFDHTITTINATQARCGQPFDAVDATPLNGISYYRLKMIDVDGKVSYSPVAAVMNGKAGAELVGIYPTVVKDQAYLSITSSRNTTMQFSISDMTGKVVATISQAVNSGSSLLPVSTSNLASGVYNITGLLDGTRTQPLRFVKE